MSSHIPNKVPTDPLWFVMDSYFKGECFTVEEVKAAFESGKTKIYISSGYSRAKEQHLESLSESDFSKLEGVLFDVVLIDSLNPPLISIKKLLPSRSYIKGFDESIFGIKWPEGEFETSIGNPIAQEYKSFIKCDYPKCREYYSNQCKPIAEKVISETRQFLQKKKEDFKVVSEAFTKVGSK
jgi:hypothetical protein